LAGDTALHPRTGIGVSDRGRYVYFLTIDGRQSASAGATIEDVGSWLKYFGSYTGTNLDGGGSTTMAWWDPTTSTSNLLNHPCGSGSYSSYDSERYNGNNIGIYYAVPEPSSFSLLAVFVVFGTGVLCYRRWWLGLSRETVRAEVPTAKNPVNGY
jgi:hypothetical protein